MLVTHLVGMIDGQVVALVNRGTEPFQVQDGEIKLAADSHFDLGVGDTLLLINDGGTWAEVCRSDN